MTMSRAGVPVMYEQDEDGSWIVSDGLPLNDGVGDTPEEALEDYEATVLEWRELLEVVSWWHLQLKP